ncbi:MAG: hypothetical protein QM758_25010 [Armatimonas sp.]
MNIIRRINSFHLLGVLLLLVAIVGLASGGKMVYDPGRVVKGNEWMIYGLAGVLMFVNGVLPSNEPKQRGDKAERK